MHRKLRRTLIKKDELLRLQQKIEAVNLFTSKQISFMLNDLSLSMKASMDTFFDVPATLFANLDAWVIKYGVPRQDFIKILSHGDGLRHLEAFLTHYEVLSQYFSTSELIFIANKTLAHHRFETLTCITTERHEAMWTDILDHAENEETVAIALPEDDKLLPFLGMD